MEFEHVIVFEYNLFGHQIVGSEHPQEHNLLYIALTRSTHRLTILLNRHTQRIMSPFLPIELIHYASELWSTAPP